MYVISLKQIILHGIVTALFIGALVLTGDGIIRFLEMPVVYFSKADGKCVKVINFKNGDGYSCPDVDVILQSYRREIVK